MPNRKSAGKFINCSQTKTWNKLKVLSLKIKKTHLRDLFGQGKSAVQRVRDFSLETDTIFLDYSKNLMDGNALKLLIELSKEIDLGKAREEMFTGAPINWTENRSVLHTLLRDPITAKFILEEKNLIPEIREVLKRMEIFASKVRDGSWRGKTGKPITDVVNIGIGGSYLGPKMTVRALTRFSDGPKIHFVSNVDGNDIEYVLKGNPGLSPKTTLFLIASKTFTTEETLTNAEIAKRWIISALGKEAVTQHFACMSTNEEKVRAFGIDPANMFEFWDFVGGRYSIWSAIGLPLMISIGPKRFREFLRGGYEMDCHFRTTPAEKNLAILLALIGIWHNNFLGAASHLILPYSSDLHYFPAYLQQMDMESNGKRVDRGGKIVRYDTGNVLWGEVGTDSQHSFFQLLHQGTRSYTADFIAFAQSQHPHRESHERLIANLFAQTESLAFGLTPEETREAVYCERGGKDQQLSRQVFLSQEQAKALIPHRVFPGNRSSNILLIDRLTPANLGKLIALYEHKVFVQGQIWGINSYDQWGVELGKRAAKGIIKLIQGKSIPETSPPHPSTTELVKRFKGLKK